jgi:hypothetical protein
MRPPQRRSSCRHANTAGMNHHFIARVRPVKPDSQKPYLRTARPTHANPTPSLGPQSLTHAPPMGTQAPQSITRDALSCSVGHQNSTHAANYPKRAPQRPTRQAPSPMHAALNSTHAPKRFAHAVPIANTAEKSPARASPAPIATPQASKPPPSPANDGQQRRITHSLRRERGPMDGYMEASPNLHSPMQFA